LSTPTRAISSIAAASSLSTASDLLICALHDYFLGSNNLLAK